MNNDSENPEEKQTSDQDLERSEEKTQESQSEPRIIYETVPEESQPEGMEVSPEGLSPEEISAEAETPEDIAEAPSQPPPSPPEGPVLPEEGRNKYLIIGGAFLVFLIIFIVILRFIFGARSSQKEVALSYWGLWEEKEIIQPLIEQYQAKNKNVKISYQKMSPQDYREKLIARSKNGQGPDIFRFHNTWLPEIRDVVSPIPKNIMDNQEFEDTFYEVHEKDLKVDDRYYGIPLMVDGLVLVYNQGLFKKAGINNAPSSWEDVIDYISRLTVKDKNGAIITSGIALGTSSNIDHFSDIFGLFLVQNGGDITKLDQPEAAGALESYRKFAEPPDNFWDETQPNSVTAFIQEKVAMIIIPSWQILTIKNANPEIDLAVVPVPSIPGSKPVSIATYWAEGVSKFSENQIEAWRFLKFLSEKETMTRLYELQSKARLFGEPYSRVDLASLLSQNEYIGPVIKQADILVSQPLISRTFDNGLNDETITYIENAISATINGESYESALKTATLGTRQVFSKYQME